MTLINLICQAAAQTCCAGWDSQTSKRCRHPRSNVTSEMENLRWEIRLLRNILDGSSTGTLSSVNPVIFESFQQFQPSKLQNLFSSFISFVSFVFKCAIFLLLFYFFIFLRTIFYFFCQCSSLNDFDDKVSEEFQKILSKKEL